jgi:hypothetical protein
VPAGRNSGVGRLNGKLRDCEGRNSPCSSPVPFPRPFNVGMVVPDPADSRRKKEPYYFDARRGPNAHSATLASHPTTLT